MVSLFHADAALYDPPPVVVGKKNGRPRVKGDKRPAPAAVVATTAERIPLEVSWYGGGRRQVEVVSGTGHWYKAGQGLVEVLWVFVHDLSGTHRDSYFFCTESGLAVAQVIQTYTGRWSIETTFQEMRAYLGLETTRGRTRDTVLRAAPCLFGLFSVVALLYAELPVETTSEATVSYRGKAEVTFSDAITAVRRQLWLEGVFQSHGQTEVFENLPRTAGRDPGGLGTCGISRREPQSRPERTATQDGRSQAEFRRCTTGRGRVRRDGDARPGPVGARGPAGRGPPPRPAPPGPARARCTRSRSRPRAAHLLATQAGRPPPPTGLEPGIGRPEPLATRAQKLGQLRQSAPSRSSRPIPKVAVSIPG